MAKWYLSAIITFFVLFDSQANVFSTKEKLPLDIRVYMSILSKKGNMLTDYEKDYMRSLGHNDINEKRPITTKTFHEAFFNELDNNSQAMKFYELGQEELAQEHTRKER